ncbi:hypothetical protein Tco_0832387 [Tanacetum coccineum]
MDYRFNPIAEQSRRTKFFSRVHSVTGRSCNKKRQMLVLNALQWRDNQPDSDVQHGGCQFKEGYMIAIRHILACVKNHELAIELFDGTLELRNAKFFPTDVYIGEVINAAKSFLHQFPFLPMPENENSNSLELLIRKVQDRIVLSTLRRSLVKAASKPR